MQRRLFPRAELLAATIVEQILDHALGEAFGFGDVRPNRRAVTALMRDRNLDAAHLLELVRQDTLVEELVPILHPGNAEFAARHQAHDPRVGRAGALGGLDEFAGVRSFFVFVDVAQPGHVFSSLTLDRGPTYVA